MAIAMSMPMPEPVRRIEVITGSDRRRMWSDEEKASIVAECLLPGRTVSAVARAHGLQTSQLFGWRRAFRKRAKADGGQPAFVPAVVPKSAPPVKPHKRKRATLPAVAHGQKAGMDAMAVEIGGAVVRIGKTADAKLVQSVLAALLGRKAACE